MITNTQTTLQQFRSFYKNHKPQNIEDAIEKFAIFGGVNWGKLDCSQDSFELIKKLILDDYTFIRNDISNLTTGMPLFHSILTGIALGDGQTHTAFKRANVENEVGTKAIKELIDLGIIRVEKDKKIFTSWDENESVSSKLYFSSPFLRFWFAFVSPLFKGIKKGDYKEIEERFENRKTEFVNLIFEQLSQEFLQLLYTQDEIIECSSYWDNKIEIDIYAKTKQGKTIVGSCKYTNSKIKKNELSKLQEKCKSANIKADIFVIFSKKGYSTELKSLKSETLKLYTTKNFLKLI